MDQKRRHAMRKTVATARRDSTPSGAIEYGLITGIIAIAIFLASSPMSRGLTDQFDRIATAIRLAFG